jgi:hypothetical protein
MRTPRAIISYPYLFTPSTYGVKPGQKPKYSCALIFPAGTDISELKKAALDCAIETFGAEKAKEMIRNEELRMPFRTDWKKKGYPEDSVFINCRTERKPGVVSIYPGPDGRPLPIENEEEIYAGCEVYATVGVFYYNQNGNEGISFGLNNVQKLADGERMDGRTNAEDDFEADMDAKAELPEDGSDEDWGF